MPDPFISTQDLIDYIGRGGTADPGLLIATDSACDTVRTIAEQTFNKVVGGTVTLDGSGTDTLLLPQLPVTAAGTVMVNGTAVTDYVLNANGILFRRSATFPSAGCSLPVLTWPAGRQNVVVTCDTGYADQDIPRDVRMVALSLAARLVVQGVATEETVGNVSVKYGGQAMDLTATEKAILRKYKPTR